MRKAKCKCRRIKLLVCDKIIVHLKCLEEIENIFLHFVTILNVLRINFVLFVVACAIVYILRVNLFNILISENSDIQLFTF